MADLGDIATNVVLPAKPYDCPEEPVKAVVIAICNQDFILFVSFFWLEGLLCFSVMFDSKISA